MFHAQDRSQVARSEARNLADRSGLDGHEVGELRAGEGHHFGITQCSAAEVDREVAKIIV